MKALDRLPALSQTVSQLLGTLAQSVPDIKRLELLINKDPALAGALLSVANSAAYSRYASTTSTMDAISRLGYSKLRRFALSQAFAKVFRFGRPAPAWSPTRFHLHSAAVGIAAELVADRLPVEHSEHAFLCGLIHDFGKLLIAVAFADHWQRIDAVALQGGSPHEMEFELLGVGHAELSAMAGERWKLPAVACDAVRRHHSPSSPSVETANLIPLSCLIQSADTFVNSLGICVLNVKPEGETILPSFNGHVFPVDGFLRDFQAEWEAMSSLCF